MKLDQVIKDVELLERRGVGNPEITRLSFDSRKVGPGELFVAIRGQAADGHAFIPMALEAGALAIICEEWPEQDSGRAVVLIVPDSRLALAVAASAYYGHPSRELSLVGVTGTNGKTTIATLLYQLHQQMDFASGLLSTIEVKIGAQSREATHTTPDPIQINAYLRQMLDAGCEYVFMEVSSHALVQERVSALVYSGAVFTNLSRDHLDYHADFRDYLQAKKRLFDGLDENAFALVNADDRNAGVMLQNCQASRHSYGLRKLCEFHGKIKEMHLEGSAMEINGREVWIQLPGRFNASNLLAVYAAAILLGHHQEDVLQALSKLEPVRGRFEVYRSDQGRLAIVDYAHSPDALRSVLETIREIHPGEGEIITVVGAGGGRDQGKRPQMARIAAETSHKVILTSDNPRHEDPESIIDDMITGVPPALKDRTLRIVSREEAIRTACMMARSGDLILVAGKGHEKTQEIKGIKKPFDDMQILKQNLKSLA